MIRRLLDNAGDALLAVRTTSPLAIVAAPAANLTVLLLGWVWLSPIWMSLPDATGGVVRMELAFAAIRIAGVLAIVTGIGDLRLADVGLRRQDLLPALAFTAVFYASLQVVLLAGGDVSIDPIWRHPGTAIGVFLGDIPSALDEEILDRGFLLVQITLLARRRFGARSSWAIGLVASQALFAVLHVPQRISADGLHGTDLALEIAGLFVRGLGFAIVYLRTGNLWLVTAFHALGNDPTSIVASSWPARVVVTWLMVAFMLAWPYVARRWMSSKRSVTRR